MVLLGGWWLGSMAWLGGTTLTKYYYLLINISLECYHCIIHMFLCSYSLITKLF